MVKCLSFVGRVGVFESLEDTMVCKWVQDGNFGLGGTNACSGDFKVVMGKVDAE